MQLPVRCGQDREQLTHALIAIAGDRVVNREVGPDRVLIAAAIALTRHIAGVAQLDDDSMHRTLGDSDTVGDLSQPDSGVIGYADQNLRVVGQEGPLRCGVWTRHRS